MFQALIQLIQDTTTRFMSQSEQLMYPSALRQLERQEPPITRSEVDQACVVSPQIQAINAYTHYIEHLWNKLIIQEPAISIAEDQRLRRFKLYIDDSGLLALDTDTSHIEIEYSEREALAIAGAIFQLGQHLDPDKFDTSKSNMLDGIAYFLMRPFAKVAPYPSVAQVAFRFNRYIHICTKQHAYSLESDDKKAARLQRIWRLRKYKGKKPERIDPTAVVIDQSISDALSAVIRNPQQPAVLAGEPGRNRATWVANQADSALADVAQVIAETTTYRSHLQFMQRLEAAVEKFNAFLHSLPETERSFVLLVPKIDSAKSNHWVTGLALPFLRKLPVKIVTQDQLAGQVVRGVKHCVVIDDAIYSGKQMFEFTMRIPKEMQTHAIVPFYTRRGLLYNREIQFFTAECMVTPGEQLGRVWQKSEQARLFNRRLETTTAFQYKYDAVERVGTFFQHGIADETSTFLWDAKSKQKEGRSEFLPQFIRKPYLSPVRFL